MSMSTHIVGFRKPDAQFKAMKAIYDSCKQVKVDIPDEVLEFFNYQEPDDSGVQINLEHDYSVMEYQDDMRSGFEVFLEDLPKNLTSIRFFNSY